MKLGIWRNVSIPWVPAGRSAANANANHAFIVHHPVAGWVEFQMAIVN
jgi:hypothetical protein